jgi:glycerophosphoryl diester phosphodiesterase
MTHDESIALFKNLGVAMTPELKEALVPMPFEGDFTQTDYAQQMIDEYVAAGINPQRVFPQSFNLEDIRYWQQAAPEFGRQAVWLDGRYREPAFDSNNAASWQPDMQQLADDGVPYLASPLWMLLTLNDQQHIVPSDYALAARAAGLKLIAWTLERSGSLSNGDNWYYQTIQSAIDDDGDMLTVLDVLARDVGVEAVFSDWPATTSYYAHCTRASTENR